MNYIKKLVQIVLYSIIFSQFTAQADTPTDEFIAAVNNAWCSSNYPALEEIITARLEEYPIDLLALGLLYEYHENIIVDYHKAYEAAQAYVTAVSNRMPSEITNRRIPMNSPLYLLELPPPTNFPPSQLKTQTQMNIMHQSHPKEFPGMFFYRSVPIRIQKLEDGIITDKDLLLLKESVFLDTETPDESEMQ